MKYNVGTVNPVKVISEKDRIRIVNTLFNVKLQVLDKVLATLLKRSISVAPFSSKFSK